MYRYFKGTTVTVFRICEIWRERERERESGGVKKEGRERERASQITILEKQQPGLDKMNESKK